MSYLIHDSPRVEAAVLESHVKTFFVAPRPPTHRPGRVTFGRRAAPHVITESTPARYVEPLTQPADVVGAADTAIRGPRAPARRHVHVLSRGDLEDIATSAASSPPSAANTSAGPRRPPHSRRSTAQASAEAAAARTLARTEVSPLRSALRHDRQTRCLALEAWQPVFLTAAPSGSSARQPVASVSSPLHGDFTSSSGAAADHSGDAASAFSTASLRWRLRRCRLGAGPASPVAADKSGFAQGHPLQVLRFLGSAIFNDSPLSTFLPVLHLWMSAARTGSSGQSGDKHRSSLSALRTYGRLRHAPRRSRSRAETLAVHLGDVEARSFRVEVLQGEASPLQALLRSYPGCIWDGSEFLLMPLVDEHRLPIELLPSALGRQSPVHVRDLDEESESVSTTGNTGPAGGPSGCGRYTANVLTLPDTPTTFLRSANASFGGFNAGGFFSDTPPPPASLRTPSSATPTPATTASAGLPGAAARNTVGMAPASVANTAAPVVPRWKRFTTAAALYLTLGQAGCCDVAHFPYAAVQLCGWDDLVGQQRTRIEMMASCSAAAIATLKAGTGVRRGQHVPVAVVLPMTRKGVMRRPLSLTTQPFTDAEVFQLLYLQLLFRTYFDVRFRGMTFALPGQSQPHLRSDFIGARSSGNRHVAFEHPTRRGEWLLFPPHTRLLTLLNLEEVVIPLYATPAELQETAAVPLFGAGDSLPCLGDVGRELLDWAATLVVHSPAAALAALVDLFARLQQPFGCTRAALWQCTTEGVGAAPASAAAPLLFRPGQFAAGAALERLGGTLSRFFVPPSRRTASAAVPERPRPSLNTPEAAPVGAGTTSGASSLRASPPPPLASLGANVACDNALSTSAGASPNTSAAREVSRHDPSRTAMFASSFDVVDLAGSRALEGTVHAIRSAVDAAIGPLRTTPLSAALEADVGQLRTIRVPEAAEGLASTTAPADSTDADLEEAAVSAFGETLTSAALGPASPFTKQESLVTRWRYYMQTGSCAIFHGTTAGLELLSFLGRGGSGLVYRGTYGTRRLPVAVKVFVIPGGMEHEHYVRESLTDVAFYVLVNQLDDFGVCYGGRAHDFIVSPQTPAGLPAEAAEEARRGGDAATTKLCYFVTDLMDGTLGRFLTEDDADFDPVYDQLLNSPLRSGELFQFLYSQLAFKTLFDWRVLDMMLNSQLRGDNVGYRYLALPPAQAAYLAEHPEEAAAVAEARRYYAGLLYRFQFGPEEPVRYLRFPAAPEATESPRLGPLRCICMIDVGQGMQPNVAQLVRDGYIGETVLDSCVEDDGFGRFWPLNQLYCQYAEVEGELAQTAAAWGSAQRVATQEDAFAALRGLFAQFYPAFGVEVPTEEELRTYLCLSWTPSNVEDLKAAYVYRAQ